MIFSVPQKFTFLPPREHRARKLAMFLLAVAPLLFGCLAVFLGQDANWDLRNYHWYNAYAFLNGRSGIDMLPSQTPWFYNPTLDVPFYLLATHLPPIATSFILGTVQGLNFVLLFMLAHAALLIANPRYKVLVCAGLAVLGMLGGGGIAQIGTVFYDNITSLGLFASALLVVRFFPPPVLDSAKLDVSASPCPPPAPPASGRGVRWRFVLLMLLSGVPAGMAMGFKLPCFTFCFGLCAAVLFMPGHPGRRLLAATAFGIGILVGVGLTLGHWGWYLQTHYGSPLFPYFNDVFKSPLAPLNSARDMQYVPRSLHDFFLFPFIFSDSPFRTGEIEWRDWRIPILYVLLPLAVVLSLVFGRSRAAPNAVAVPGVARYLLWAAVLSYFSWLIMFAIYRYLVPLEMLAPLLIVFAVGMLPVKPMARGLLALFILLVIAVTVQGGNWGRHNQAWLKHYVEIERPELGDVSNTLLLMAGFEPYSHIVTQFPPEMPVVRIQSNFASPDQDKGINQLVHTRVDGHTGSFLILIPDWQHEMAGHALGYFQLAADWKACQIVKDHLFNDTILHLCPVFRQKG